jgi:hypothetical protein
VLILLEFPRRERLLALAPVLLKTSPETCER